MRTSRGLILYSRGLLKTKENALIAPESITVVLPVHSRKQLTISCLHSLFRQHISGFKVIVVDSGSMDGTADAVEAEFPNVIVLRHGNLWWTGATNKGVERALVDGAKYILTINDDLEFPGNYLEAMSEAAASHPLAIMGSYALNLDTKEPMYCGERMNWVTAKRSSLLDIIPPQNRHGLLKVSYFSARGLWLPAEVFSRIGLFDAKHLPHYVADHEFTARAANVGFDVYVNCDAVLYNRRDYLGPRNNLKHFSWKNFRKHLFSIQGGGNLKNFTVFAFQSCPRRYLPLFWIMGISRCIGGYLREWLMSKMPRQHLCR